MKSEPNFKPEKARIRKSIRRQRSALTAGERRVLDEMINRHLLDHAGRAKPGTIAAYAAFDGEPDLEPALRQLYAGGVRLALPVIEEGTGRPTIGFRQWLPDSETRLNRFGIPEPVGTLELRLSEIDLALVPLVAWDESGGRLGMGASFYDRLFEPFAADARPFRMGVAYRLQRVDHIPLDPWDVRMHGVLTESGCLHCRSGS